MAFWTSETLEPKRKNKFIIEIGGKRLLNVKSVTKPTYSVDTKEYTLINHKFKYPALVTWEPIKIVLVDSLMGQHNDTEKTLYQMINDSGYSIPTVSQHVIGSGGLVFQSIPEKAANQAQSFWATYTKQRGESEVQKEYGGFITIKQINAEGKTIDAWRLFGPIIKSISFGELNYESDDLVEYTLDIEYDFAEYLSDGASSQLQFE
tara:strand:- start:54 stop:671 length:618 start_codon:yes stop_codon:yes gene_type:complete